MIPPFGLPNRLPETLSYQNMIPKQKIAHNMYYTVNNNIIIDIKHDNCHV